MMFNPIKTSSERYCAGTIPNKLTHYEQSVYDFFFFPLQQRRYYLLRELPAVMETDIKLVRRMFYGQKVSISKFKFSLSSLVLHCYLRSTFPLVARDTRGLPSGI